MFIDELLLFVKEFINQLDDGLSQGQSVPRLSSMQKAWLGFCLMGILITNSVCWAKSGSSRSKLSAAPSRN
jgi:hypothetical protein